MRWSCALVGLLLACEPESSSSSGEVTHEVDAPRSVIDGCNEQRDDECEILGDVDHLDIWLDQPAGSTVELRVDGTVVADAAFDAVDGGQHVRIAVSDSTSTIELRGVQPAWRSSIHITIRRAPQMRELRAARALASSGDFAGAHAQVTAAKPVDVRGELEVLRMRREIHWQSGDVQSAHDITVREHDLASSSGHPMIAARAAAMVCHIHDERGDLESAETWCGRVSRAAAHAPALAPIARYYDGLLAARRGDTHRAQDDLTDAWRLALRVADPELLADIGGKRAMVAAERGAIGEAERALAEIAAVPNAAELHCSDRALMRNNAAWTAITLAEAGVVRELPFELLDAALAAFAEGGECPNVDSATNVTVNLALAHLLDDEPQLAADVLEPLRLLDDSPLAPWIDEVGARIDLALGRWDRVSELRPIVVGDPALAWLASLRWADQLERLGLRAAAIDVYLELEDRLDAAMRSAGLAAEHERLLAARAMSAVRLVELLLAEGRRDEALCRARLAAARGVHVLDRRARTSSLDADERAAWTEALREHADLRAAIERERATDWQLPADQLERVRIARAERLRDADASVDEAIGAPTASRTCDALPDPSETRPLLVAFPGDGATSLLLHDGRATHVLRAYGPPDASAIGHTLRPALAALHDAEHLTVIAVGELAALRFHALIDAVPIAYGLDLPPRDESTHARTALVFADPSGDLAAAAHEVEAIERILGPRGWTVQIRRGPQATMAELVVGLEHATLFHYAGHGERAAKPWDAALRLHDDAPLRVGDVLLLPEVPPHVVLAGCHTGARDPESLTGGLSLGRAFLLAGAEQVLVSDDEVPDDVTSALVAALYELGAPDDLAAALSRAQRRLAAAGIAGTEAFRVLTR